LVLEGAPPLASRGPAASELSSILLALSVGAQWCALSENVPQRRRDAESAEKIFLDRVTTSIEIA
jgi:hypothetical protein